MRIYHLILIKKDKKYNNPEVGFYSSGMYKNFSESFGAIWEVNKRLC